MSVVRTDSSDRLQRYIISFLNFIIGGDGGGSGVMVVNDVQCIFLLVVVALASISKLH